MNESFYAVLMMELVYFYSCEESSSQQAICSQLPETLINTQLALRQQDWTVAGPTSRWPSLIYSFSASLQAMSDKMARIGHFYRTDILMQFVK